MGWPAWIDELKGRYLADEGNVFVLQGEIAARFPIPDPEADGSAGTVDAVQLLVRFLKRSREIVGVLRPAPLPSRLEFADHSDRQRFENLVKASDLLQGRTLPLSEAEPHSALGRIWRALSTTGTAQAYLVTEAERLLPSHRRRLDPIPGAPELVDWAIDPTLSRSNNLVGFFATDLAKIRPELVERGVVIGVSTSSAPRRPTPASATVQADATDEVPRDNRPPEREPTDDGLPGVPPLPVDAAPQDLRGDLERALGNTLASHPAAHRPAHLPVMAAVAAVVAARRPDKWGALTFGLDPEGNVQVTGAGADAFQAAWRGDIALDASASMLIKALERSPDLDNTAVSALVRRVERLLK